jgi:hypothetical protein
MNTTMETLLQLIQDIENDPNIEPMEYVPILLPAVMEIQSIAEHVLITEKGECNWENIKILQTNNIRVFPVEWDVGGWIVGGLMTKKGIITYG